MSAQDIQLRIVLGIGGMGSIEELNKGLKGTGTAAGDAASGMRAAGAAGDKSVGMLERLRSKLDELQTKYHSVWKAGFELQLLGGQLKDIGEKGLDTLTGTVDKYGDYDLILRRAGVALNTNAQYSDLLNDAILTTSKNVGLVSPEQTAEAYYMWGAATGEAVDSQDKLARITGVVSKLLVATAAAGGDLESNLKGVYGVTQQYNMGIGAASDVTEKLTVMTERTAADFGDLTQAFIYTGASMGNIGVTFEDTAQMMGILADAGFRGSKAGRGLSMVMEGIVSPTDKAKGTLDKLAKSITNNSQKWDEMVFPDGKFIGTRALIDKMAESMKNMTPVQRQQVINTIMTNNATRALLPILTKQLNLWDEQAKSGHKLTNVLDEQKYSLKTSGEYFQNVQEQMTGSIDAVRGSFENSFFPIIQQVALRIMEVAAPAMKGLADVFTKVGDVLKKNKPLMDIVIVIVALGSAALAVVGTMLVFAGTAFIIAAGWATVGPILALLAGGFVSVLAPVLAVIAVVALLYKAWTENFGGIQQKAQMVFDYVKGLVDQLVPKFQALATAIVTFVQTHVIPALTQLAGMFMQVWSIIQPILLWFAETIVKTFMEEIVPAIMSLINEGIALLIDILTQLGPVIDVVVQVMQILVDFLVNDMAPVWSWLTENVVKPFLSFLIAAVTTTFKGVADIISGVMKVIHAVISTVLDVIKGVFTAFLRILKGDWQGAWDAILNMLRSIWSRIVEFIRGVVQTIWGIIQVWLSKILNKFGEILGAVFTTIRGGFGTIIKLGGELLGKLWSGISGAVGGFLGHISSFIVDLLGKTGFGKALLGIGEIGKNIVTGLWNGMKSMLGWIIGKVQAFITSAIPGPIKDLLNIHSPSRVTMELGKYVAMGLAIGIASGTPDVMNSVDTLSNAVVDRLGSRSVEVNTAFGDMGASGSSNFSVDTSNSRTVTLRVEVRSPDGSVSAMDTEKLANLLRGSDVLDAIEHAASLD